jgi:hypothetical protein
MAGNLKGDRVRYEGERVIPGLVILNDTVIGGDAGILRELHRTQAFVVETPELKSKQGVFGTPLFLHRLMQVREPMEIGLANYLLFGFARVQVGEPQLWPREILNAIIIE